MEDREHAESGQRESQNNPPEPLGRLSTPPTSNPENPHRDQVHNQPHSEPENPRFFVNPDWWMVALTALTVFVAGVTLRVFWKQFQEMQTQTGILTTQARQATQDSIEASQRVERQLSLTERQAKASEDSVKAIQRQTRSSEQAYIDILFPDTNITVADAKPVAVKVTFKNDGKTTARKIFAEAVINIVENGKNPTFDYTWDHARTTTGLLPQGDSLDVVAETMEHKRTIGKNGRTRNITHEEFVRYRDGETYIVLYARVAFSDVFGIGHWTKRCMFVAHAAEVTGRRCTDYADVDSH